jgi:hypothetical protein
VNRASAAHREMARALLAHEGAGASSSADECATAAGQLYDKIHARLAPLLGAAGVEALLARSARLTQDAFPCLAGAPLDATKLRSRLQQQEPAVAMEAAVALFATFLALITTFIGDRLTSQVLRSAWPTADEMAPGDKRK